MIQTRQNVSDKDKKASLERLINQYHQAKADGNTPQIKRLESILKRLGYNKLKV
jgi:hypothetical protein